MSFTARFSLWHKPVSEAHPQSGAHRAVSTLATCPSKGRQALLFDAVGERERATLNGNWGVLELRERLRLALYLNLESFHMVAATANSVSVGHRIAVRARTGRPVDVRVAHNVDKVAWEPHSMCQYWASHSGFVGHKGGAVPGVRSHTCATWEHTRRCQPWASHHTLRAWADGGADQAGKEGVARDVEGHPQPHVAGPLLRARRQPSSQACCA